MITRRGLMAGVALVAMCATHASAQQKSEFSVSR